MWLDDQYPNWREAGCEITSPCDSDYNCIAWALGIDSDYITYLPGFTWPARRRSQLIEDLVDVFANYGFEQCSSIDVGLEPGYTKVALYAKGRLWMHASRQLRDGTWTSKLGPDEDVRHPTPESVAPVGYGSVYCIMKKKENG